MNELETTTVWCAVAIEADNPLAGVLSWRSDIFAMTERAQDAALSSPLKKALLTGFHSTAKHNATKAVSPSSETMRTI